VAVLNHIYQFLYLHLFLLLQLVNYFLFRDKPLLMVCLEKFVSRTVGLEGILGRVHVVEQDRIALVKDVLLVFLLHELDFDLAFACHDSCPPELAEQHRVLLDDVGFQSLHVRREPLFVL